MTMVRDIELVQLLEDAKEFVARVEPDSEATREVYEREEKAREHLMARLETEIRRRRVLR